jgi:hypothetical protein
MSWRSAWQPTSTIVQGIEIRHGNFLRRPPYSSRGACVSEGGAANQRPWRKPCVLTPIRLSFLLKQLALRNRSPDSRSLVARLNSNDCRQQVAVVAAALEVSAAAESDRARQDRRQYAADLQFRRVLSIVVVSRHFQSPGRRRWSGQSSTNDGRWFLRSVARRHYRLWPAFKT